MHVSPFLVEVENRTRRGVAWTRSRWGAQSTNQQCAGARGSTEFTTATENGPGSTTLMCRQRLARAYRGVKYVLKPVTYNLNYNISNLAR